MHCWITNHIKCGKGSNWEGTSSGVEEDMLDELLHNIKSKRYSTYILTLRGGDTHIHANFLDKSKHKQACDGIYFA